MKTKKRVHPDELGNFIGCFIILWRKKDQAIARINEVDVKERKIRYTIVYGKDAERRMRSPYDTSQTIFVFGDFKDAFAEIEGVSVLLRRIIVEADKDNEVSGLLRVVNEILDKEENEINV